jgi:hypothetical protein
MNSDEQRYSSIYNAFALYSIYPSIYRSMNTNNLIFVFLYLYLLMSDEKLTTHNQRCPTFLGKTTNKEKPYSFRHNFKNRSNG